MTLFAWTPFLEPLNCLQPYWYLLLLPFAFGIAVIYKAYHLVSLEHYWREVALMGVQIVAAMIGLGVALAVLLLFVIPALPVIR